MEKKKNSSATTSKNVDVKKSIKKTAVKEVEKTTTSKKTKNDIKKNITKNTKPKDNNVIVTESAGDELKKLGTILAIIIGIVCLFYIITVLVTKHNSGLKYQSNSQVSQISYTDILASDILNKGGQYYVLVEDQDDHYISLFENYISSYISSDDSLDVYYVDLNDALNKNYRADESDFSVDNLKFAGTTLLKISDGNIENTYDTSDSINSQLKSLILE